MTRGRRQAYALALAAALSLVLAPVAAAHSIAPAATPGQGAQPAVDPSEVAALGLAHAEEHARLRAVQAAAHRQWARLTPHQRTARLTAAKRQTAALNARIAATSARDDSGYWEPALRPLPEYAVHAVMLPTGKILIFGRALQAGAAPLGGTFIGGTRSNIGSATVFDPLTGATQAVPPPTVAGENVEGATSLPQSLFCAGQALLSDGRVLIVGGNLTVPGQPGVAGIKRTFIFDPWNLTWQLGPQMSHGRWYPTVTKLSSGDMLIASGDDENALGHINPYLDVFHPVLDEGTPPTEPPPLVHYPAGDRENVSLYPSLFLLPNSNLALAGPGQFDNAILDGSFADDPGRTKLGGSAWTDISGSSATEHHFGGAPLRDPDMNAFAGSWDLLSTGGAAQDQSINLATRTVDRLTAGPGAPHWTHDPAEDMNQARYYLNDVALPDGGVVAIGGGLGSDQTVGNYYLGPYPPGGNPSPPPELKRVELRRPGDRTWRLGAAQQEYRTYHSTALLLPDGRIMSAGDDGHEGPLNDPQRPQDDPNDRRDSAEMFWPPYLFNGEECAPRPVIRDVGAVTLVHGAPVATLAYGEQFGIFSEHAQPGMQAVLVAPGAVTHSVDTNQRVVPLQIASTVAAGGLNAITPPTAAAAPPGYYMLFVVSPDGTPSTSRWVRLLPNAVAIRGGGAAATVSGTWPDAQRRSCTDPDGTVRFEPDAPLPAVTPPAPPPPLSTPPPPPPPPAPAAQAKGSSKLTLDRARIVSARRELDVLAQISARATGRVRFDLFSAGVHTRLSAPIDTAHRRVSLHGKIPPAQAKLGTGILTISYGGDDRTRPLSVRLRAARRPADLRPARPSYAAGLLRASGTISARASGLVRVQLEYDHDGKTVTVERSAAIAKGGWKLSARLPAAVRSAIAGRSGTLDAYVLFTGSQAAGMRGEMRAYQVLGAP